MPPAAAGGGAGAAPALGGGPVTAEAVDIATELQVKPPMAFWRFVWEASHAVGVPQWGGGGAARPSVPGAGAACSVLGAVGEATPPLLIYFADSKKEKILLLFPSLFFDFFF